MKIAVLGTGMVGQTLDLGDITGSRQLEMVVLLWVRLWGTLNTADFNLKVVR